MAVIHPRPKQLADRGGQFAEVGFDDAPHQTIVDAVSRRNYAARGAAFREAARQRRIRGDPLRAPAHSTLRASRWDATMVPLPPYTASRRACS